MDNVVWAWSRDRIQDLAETYAEWNEGTDDQPALFVQMSPAAVLALMDNMGLQGVQAMVRMPGEPKPRQVDLAPARMAPLAFTPVPEPLLVDEPPVDYMVQTILRGCTQCGQAWSAWACGPTHAMIRNELGIEYQPDGRAELPDPKVDYWSTKGPYPIVQPDPTVINPNLPLVHDDAPPRHRRPDPATWDEAHAEVRRMLGQPHG